MSGLPPNSLVSKTISAVEVFCENELLIETNTQIRLDTPNLLVNFEPFDQYIRNLVFGGVSLPGTFLDRTTANITQNLVNGAVNITESFSNDGTYEVENVFCSNMDARQSYILDGLITKCPCISISSSNSIRFGTTSNITYTSNNSTLSLGDYIYNILNRTVDKNIVPAVPLFQYTGTEYDISNFGTFHTNRLITSNIKTSSNVHVGNHEPIFDIISDSAINLQIYGQANEHIASNIYIGSGDLNLKDYIYSFLDETVVYKLTMSGTGHPGTEISLNNIVFRRVFIDGISPFLNVLNDPFTYDIVFKIYEYNASETPTNPFGTIAVPVNPNVIPSLNDVVVESTIETTLIFNNLNEGTFYSIYADITNNVTNTTVNNIRVDSNIPTIIPQTILSIILTHDNIITIVFEPHMMPSSIDLTTQFSIREGTNEWVRAGTQNFSDHPNYTNNNKYTYLFQSTTSYFNYPSTYIFTLRNGLDMQKTGKIYIINQNYISSDIDGIGTIQTINIAAPRKPGTPTLQKNQLVEGTSGILSWESGTQEYSVVLTYIRYEIYCNTIIIHTTSDLYTNVIINTGDTYYVKAINYYAQSNDSDILTINTPTVKIDSIYFDSVREYSVSYTIGGINGIPNVITTVLNGTVNSTATNLTITLDNIDGIDIDFEVNITVTDSLDLSATDKFPLKLSINFNIEPQINLDIGEGEVSIVLPTNLYDSVYSYTWSSDSIDTWSSGSIDSVISISPSNEEYSCNVTETNPLGFFKTHYLSVSTTIPESPGAITYTNVTYNSFVINWTIIGSHGDPNQNNELFIYYNDGVNYVIVECTQYDENDTSTYTQAIGPVAVKPETNYFVKMVKRYNYYGLFESEEIEVLTPILVTEFDLNQSSQLVLMINVLTKDMYIQLPETTSLSEFTYAWRITTGTSDDIQYTLYDTQTVSLDVILGIIFVECVVTETNVSLLTHDTQLFKTKITPPSGSVTTGETSSYDSITIKYTVNYATRSDTNDTNETIIQGTAFGLWLYTKIPPAPTDLNNIDLYPSARDLLNGKAVTGILHESVRYDLDFNTIHYFLYKITTTILFGSQIIYTTQQSTANVPQPESAYFTHAQGGHGINTLTPRFSIGGNGVANDSTEMKIYILHNKRENVANYVNVFGHGNAIGNNNPGFDEYEALLAQFVSLGGKYFEYKSRSQYPIDYEIIDLDPNTHYDIWVFKAYIVYNYGVKITKQSQRTERIFMKIWGIHRPFTFFNPNTINTSYEIYVLASGGHIFLASDTEYTNPIQIPTVEYSWSILIHNGTNYEISSDVLGFVIDDGSHSSTASTQNVTLRFDDTAGILNIRYTCTVAQEYNGPMYINEYVTNVTTTPTLDIDWSEFFTWNGYGYTRR